MFVLIDGDYSCTNANEWMFQGLPVYTVPAGGRVYIQVTNKSSSVGALGYDWYYWQDPGNRSLGTAPIGGTVTGSYACSQFPLTKFIIHNQYTGTGLVTNNVVHIKVWIQ